MYKNLSKMDELDSKDLKVIHQFLITHNFESTAEEFLTEASKWGFTNWEDTSNIEGDEDAYKQIMSSFKTGDWKKFFEIWNSLIPENVKQTKEYKILMLNLHVHFAVLPKRTLFANWSKEQSMTNSPHENDSKEREGFITDIEKNVDDSMVQLREYLNTTGKELECEAHLRPFFALPFIEDPYAEPFLSKIFSESWLDELTENLHLFINKHKPNFLNSWKVLSNDQAPYKFSSTRETLGSERKENANSTRKMIMKNNVPITPNDRNIPIFVENDDIGEQLIFSNKLKYDRKTKCTQTYIKGNQLTIDSFKEDANDKRFIQYTQELAVTKSHLCSVHSNYEKLKVRFHKLHADYHKLISVAGELTAALENSVKGQAVDLQAMLETCIKIFPDLFNQNIRDSSQFSSTTQLDKLQTEMKAVDLPGLSNTAISTKLLDFKKIKAHLISGNVKTKLFLLQALRRKITLGQSGERDEAIHEYISKDLLGLHGQIASDNGKSILPYLLAPGNIITPHPLQQSAARLLNVLASFRCGRDYLSYGSIVVNVILKCLNNASKNEVDAITYNMMIATLQKLSLRKQQRIYMIENGLVEWLIHHLHDECRIMDSYRLEFATALLMNLSLHRAAQQRASVMASLLISTLLTLLSIDHVSALPYVNGALNNFLSNQVINDEAKRIKLSVALEYYRKNKTGEIRKHFDHILQIHRGEKTINIEDEETADDDNEEFDILENELEENDPVKNYANELCGEMLLATCYAISPKLMQERSLTTDTSSIKNDKIHITCLHHAQQQDIISCHNHQSAACAKHFLPRSKDRKRGLKKQSQIPLQEIPNENATLWSEFRPRVPTFVSSLFKDKQSRKPFHNDERNSAASNENKAFTTYNKFLMTESRNTNDSNAHENFNVLRDPCYPIVFQRIRPNEKFEELNNGRNTNSDASLQLAQNINRDAQINKRRTSSNQLYHSKVNADQNFLKRPCNESAVYLYANQTSKESSKTTIRSSMILTPARESTAVGMEKLSSIASLNVDKDNEKSTSNTPWEEKLDIDEEAFLAKPKLSRTPP